MKVRKSTGLLLMSTLAMIMASCVVDLEQEPMDYPSGPGTDKGPVITDNTDIDNTDIDNTDIDNTDIDNTDIDVPPNDTTIVAKKCGQLPVLASGEHCDVSAGTSGALIIRSNILAPGTVYQGGSILLNENGIIKCVGCNCESESLAAGATVLTCPDAVVSPALINAHEHITWGKNAKPANYTDERYEHRHNWRKGKESHSKIPQDGSSNEDDDILYGELRHLMAGALTMAGSGKAKGLMRNIDKEDLASVVGGNVYYQTFPLGDSDGKMLTSGCSYGWKDDLSKLKNECYMPHIAEGINTAAHNEFLCMSGQGQGSRDLVEANTAIVHAVGMSAIDGAEVADNNASIIWSPRSNVSLYGNTAPVTMYHNQGINIAMGTDWVLSGSANMVREMACADYMNKKHYGSFFKPSDIWRMATENGAIALEVDDKIGFLKTGFIGDIAIYALNGGASDDNVETYFQSIIDSTPDEVVLILRSGEMVFGDSDILSAAKVKNCESMGDVCGSSKTICMSGANSKYKDIKDGGAYKLFYCNNKWASEPPCVPKRNNKNKNGQVINFGSKVSTYDGTTSKNDSDGDGVSNDEDNCPTIFNPIRPMDKGVQADADGDGLGDLCDPCPMDTDNDKCGPATPGDLDNDGVPDNQDNCPGKYNPPDAEGLQPDADGDGKGDACDECPNNANPGDEVCPAVNTTIADVQSGKIKVDTRVNLEGIVSAVAANNHNSFFIQSKGSFASKDEAKYQGLYVYIDAKEAISASAANLVIGSTVRVSGTVNEYFGEKELGNLEKLEVMRTNVVDVVPLELEISDFSSKTATPYDALLATVKNVNIVTGGTSYFYIGQTGSTGKVLVSNKIWTNTSSFENGDVLSSATGIVMFAKTGDATASVNSLQPRFSADLAQDCSAGSSIVAMNPPELVIGKGKSGSIILSRNCPGEEEEIELTAAPECAGLLTVAPASFSAKAATASATVTAANQIGSCKISYGNFETTVKIINAQGYSIGLSINGAAADTIYTLDDVKSDTYILVARDAASYAAWQAGVRTLHDLPAQVPADKVIFVNLQDEYQFNGKKDDTIYLYNWADQVIFSHLISGGFNQRQNDGTFEKNDAPVGADGKAPAVISGVNEPLYLYETGIVSGGTYNYFIFYIP